MEVTGAVVCSVGSTNLGISGCLVVEPGTSDGSSSSPWSVASSCRVGRVQVSPW